MQNLLKDLETVLSQDDRFMADGKILKNAVIEAALDVDADFLKLLLGNAIIKEHFFTDIDGALVFDKVKFQEFVSNKQFLKDSYTAFRNRLGLGDDKSFLKESKDVVLAWAYKDCVLEGGMTKEDRARDEIFYNTTLAPDDITRLTDKKVFTSFEYWDKAAVKAKKAKKVKDIGQSENLLIKGNNLLALHCLKHRYAGKVKLIYIDPPYNTENDSFRYNDSFNHSTWLTFMKNRLEVARELLSDDGVIFVHCDKNEFSYLKVLMDEVLGIENFIEMITVVNNPRGRDYGGIANMHEFILVYSKSKVYSLNELEVEGKEFPYEDNLGGFEVHELRNRNADFHKGNRSNLFYPFYVNPQSSDGNGLYEVSLKKMDNWIEVLPKKSRGVQTVWRWGREKSQKNLNVNVAAKKMRNGKFQIVKKYRKTTRMARSVWWDKEVNSERGTLHLKQLFDSKLFDYPKPEETLKRVINIVTKEGDLVLDFFAGSGTTSAVSHKMGRRWIAVEQMDYIKDLPEARLRKVIEGEQGGISKTVGWKGGGDFIYCEIMEWNERYVQEIRQAKATEALLKIYKKLKDEPFIRYDVDMSAYEEDDFQKLDFKEQQKALLACIEVNHLYVNYSEMEDARYKVSADDQKLSKQFYGDKG